LNGYKEELNKAIELVQRAATIVNDIRKRHYEIRDKGHGQGPVTDADMAVNDFLVIELSKNFPSDLIVSEEASLPKDFMQDRRVWFIDPIDGTKDFINKSEDWSIMLGMAINARPTLGAIYQPDKDKLYYASEGSGAFMKHGKTIKKITTRSIREIKEAVLIQSRSHFSKKVSHVAQKLGITRVIQQGSIGLKFCTIAEGNADLYLNYSNRCHLWDLCAPEIILREAGGIVVHDQGEPLSYAYTEAKIDTPFVAAAGTLAESIQGILK
jgi:3'(2'), 5'-bisphosphate nucleotidase